MKKTYVAPMVEQVVAGEPLMQNMNEWSLGLKGNAGDDKFGDGDWAPEEGDEADAKNGGNLWDGWDD